MFGKFLKLILPLLFWGGPAVGLAERPLAPRIGDCRLSDAAQKVSTCAVGIRTIQGVKSTGKSSISAALVDIRSQLTSLPFQSFSVIESQQKSIRCNDRGVFSMTGARQSRHRIAVTPLHLVKKKVQLMVDWNGPAGEQLVSTKLRLLNGNSVVLGTDSSGTEATIVSIKLNCR